MDEQRVTSRLHQAGLKTAPSAPQATLTRRGRPLNVQYRSIAFRTPGEGVTSVEIRQLLRKLSCIGARSLTRRGNVPTSRRAGRGRTWIVVWRLACPSVCWTRCGGAPRSRAWLAWAWRKKWGETASGNPARRAKSFTTRHSCCRVSGRADPSAPAFRERSTGPSGVTFAHLALAVGVEDGPRVGGQEHAARLAALAEERHLPRRSSSLQRALDAVAPVEPREFRDPPAGGVEEPEREGVAALDERAAWVGPSASATASTRWTAASGRMRSASVSLVLGGATAAPTLYIRYPSLCPKLRRRFTAESFRARVEAASPALASASLQSWTCWSVSLLSGASAKSTNARTSRS